MIASIISEWLEHFSKKFFSTFFYPKNIPEKIIQSKVFEKRKDSKICLKEEKKRERAPSEKENNGRGGHFAVEKMTVAR